MKDFITFQLGIIIHPISTLKQFLKHERRLFYGFITILLFGICYTIAVIFAYIFGHLSYGIPIILKIPIEKYYLFESFFLLPVTISTWIIMAGLIQIISIPFKGKGSFEDTLSMIGLPYILLVIFMLIPDIITDYLLPKSIVRSYAYWNIINLIKLFLATFWIMIIHIIAVKEVQKLTNTKAIIVSGQRQEPRAVLPKVSEHLVQVAESQKPKTKLQLGRIQADAQDLRHTKPENHRAVGHINRQS